MSKAAVEALMRNIAVAYRDRGIRCNAIAPAFVRTPHGMNEIRDFRALGLEWSEADLAATQLRMRESEGVAAVGLLRAAREACFVNGVAPTVDIGRMADA